MPVKRRKIIRRVGRGLFDRIWSGIKTAAPYVNNFLKDTKIISKVAPLIPEYGAAIGTVAGALGYGRRRRRLGRGFKILPVYRPRIGGRRKVGGNYSSVRSSNLAF